MDLTVNDGGVDDDAGVVARRVPHEPDLAGIAIDLDHGKMHTERERCRRRLKVVLRGERFVRLGSLRRARRPADGHTRRTGHGKRPRGGIENDVRRIGLEDLGRNPLRLLDHGLGRFPDRSAADLQRT